MTVELFMTMLTICSVLTSLTVEAFKKSGWFKCYNILALIISLVIGTFVCFANYINLMIPFTFLNIMYMIGFVFLNWLVATLGYDKVMQSLKQFIGK